MADDILSRSDEEQARRLAAREALMAETQGLVGGIQPAVERFLGDLVMSGAEAGAGASGVDLGGFQAATRQHLGGVSPQEAGVRGLSRLLTGISPEIKGAAERAVARIAGPLPVKGAPTEPVEPGADVVADVVFAGGGGYPAGGVGMSGAGSISLSRGPSVAPITEARKRIEALPGEFAGRRQEARKGLQGAYEQLQTAATGVADAQSAAAQAEADIITLGQSAARIEDARQSAIMDAARQRVTDTMGKYEQATQALSAMRVDPRRRYSGGSRVGAAIAMALGAMGSALTRGGPNAAMQIIQAEIDRDIAAQRAAIEKQRGVVGLAQAEVGMARALWQDAGAQRAAAERAVWDRVKMDLMRQAAQSRSETIKAGVEQTVGEIDAKRAALESEMLEREFTGTLQAAQLGLSGATSEVGAGMQRAQLSNQAKLQEQALRAKGGGLAPPPTLALVDPAYRPTKKDTEKAQAMSSAYGKVYGELAKLRAWRDKYGAEKLNQAALTEGEMYRKRAKSALRALDKTGANMTPNEEALMGLDFEAGDFGFIMERIDTLMGSVTDGTVAEMRPYGYTLRNQALASRMRRAQ